MKKFIRKSAAVFITLALLCSMISLNFSVLAANDYEVSLTNVYGRTPNDGEAGDNWNDYIVFRSKEIQTIDSNKAIDGNQGFVAAATRKKTYMVFKFDAGGGNVFKDTVVSWQGRAITQQNNAVSVYLGANFTDGTPDSGEWILLDAIGANSSLYASNNNYANPSKTDISEYTGNSMQYFYIKVEMYTTSTATRINSVFSNLSVSSKTEAGTHNTTVPTKFATDGIEEPLALSCLENRNFSVAVYPISLTDRTVKVESDDDCLTVSEQSGVYTLSAVFEGKTNLRIISNLNSAYSRVIPVTIGGVNYFYSDEFQIMSGDESGNISGEASSFISNDSSGYGLISFTDGDYLVRRGVDFSAFGGMGASSLRLIAGYDNTHTEAAEWDIYADSIADGNLLCTLYITPYGEDASVKQEIYGGFAHAVTGKRDIYMVQRKSGAKVFDIAFGNFEPNYTANADDTFADGGSNAFKRHIVTTRGFKSTDGDKTLTAAESGGEPGEIIYRFDAENGQTFKDMELRASVRNISSGNDLGSVGFYVSYDMNKWYNIKQVTSSLENGEGDPDRFTVEEKLDNFVKGKERVYIKISLHKAAKALDSWNSVSRITINSTSTANASPEKDVTDIALSAVPEIKWYSNVGTVSVTAGDTIKLTAVTLPATATDSELTVTSSDQNALAIQPAGNGIYNLVAFEEGSVLVTVTAPSGVRKSISVAISAQPTVKELTLSANPNKNPNVEIVDEGTKHLLNDVYCSWTGDTFGVGNTTPGDYVLFKNVDFAEFAPEGPVKAYIKASNYSGETTDKTWSAYVDSISPDNKIASFTVRPFNGWDYQQIITSELSKQLTGVHNIYLVCEVGGSVWSLTFTDDSSIGQVSYDLPFSTVFDAGDSMLFNHIVESKGISFSGQLVANDCGANYNKENPVKDASALEVNGYMILRFDKPANTELKNAILSYAGRSIISPETDPSCVLPGIIEFYISRDMQDWEKIAEFTNTNGSGSVNLASRTDGLETFYIRIDIKRTSSFASWTRLTSFEISCDIAAGEVDYIYSNPEPAGITLPFTTDFSDNAWKDGMIARSAGIAVQYSVDSMDLDVACLQPSTTRKYEGVIFKFVPEAGKKIDNILLRLNGRAIGGSIVSAMISTDKENWREAVTVSDSAVSDDNYNGLKLFAETQGTPADVIYLQLTFFSTGESFIDYAAVTDISVSTFERDGSEENIPFNTVFSTARTQINSWLRHVTDLKGLFVSSTASTINMSPATGKSGFITLRFNSGDTALKTLFTTVKGKAINGSEIALSISKNGKDFKTISYINEQSDEYASSSTYAHEYDVSSEVGGSQSVWIRLDLTASGAAANCTLNALSVSYNGAYKVSETMPDRWQNYVYDMSMFDEDEITDGISDIATTSDTSNPRAAVMVCIISLAVLLLLSDKKFPALCRKMINTIKH